MKIVMGEEFVTTGPKRADDADTIRGDGWEAVRRDGRYFLQYDGGDIQSKEVSLEITVEEFERLRADKSQFLPIVYAHGA